MIRTRTFLAAAMAVSGLLAGRVLADEIVFRGIGALKDVRITGIAEGNILYTTSAGRDSFQPLNRVVRFSLDNEPSLAPAEQAWDAALRDPAPPKWEAAATAYEKLARTTGRAWLKQYAEQRLTDASARSGRFDIAIKQAIGTAQKNPDAARAIRLNWPAPTNQMTADAIATLKGALGVATTDKSREALLTWLLAGYTLKNDTKGMEEASQQLMQVRFRINPNSPEALRAAVQAALAQVGKELAARQYDRALQMIDSEAAKVVEPADQAQAMWYYAEAKAGKAAASADADTWKEVAVAYMRIVANAPAGDPHIPQAMLKTAAILADRVKDKDGAVKLYRDIVKDYKDLPAAQTARAELARLEKK